MSKLDELLKAIKDDPNLKYYQELEVKINDSIDIKQLVNDIKKLQTDIVLARELGKTAKQKQLEESYDQMLIKLEKVPHVLEYLELQKHYNDLIQMIKQILEEEIETIFQATNQNLD